jgi:hypothetical protein
MIERAPIKSPLALRSTEMKILTAATLAAGLVALSLPANAASATSTGTPAFKPRMSSELIQVAQRSENPGGGMFRNENPGGGMYKKSKKKKSKKK